MRLVVCGGRDITDTDYVYGYLDAFDRAKQIDVIIEGDCRGVDRMAGYWARKHKRDDLKYPPNLAKYGSPAAYHIRNQQMIDEGKPDAAMVFNGGKGTRSMVGRLIEAGIEIHYAT